MLIQESYGHCFRDKAYKCKWSLYSMYFVCILVITTVFNLEGAIGPLLYQMATS